MIIIIIVATAAAGAAAVDIVFSHVNPFRPNRNYSRGRRVYCVGPIPTIVGIAYLFIVSKYDLKAV